MQWLMFLAVGLLWGVTNPLLNKGGHGMSAAGAGHSSQVIRFLRETWYILTRWQFIVPFALNQFGSALYMAAVATSDLSLALPICNSLAFLFTALTARFLGERPLPPSSILGVILVLCGTALCLWSRQPVAQGGLGFPGDGSLGGDANSIDL